MCLQAQGIYNDNGGFGGGRRSRGLSKDDRGVGGGRVIDDASEGLETTMEAEGGSTTGPRDIIQQQRRRRRNMSMKNTTTTTELTTEDIRRFQGIRDDDGVSSGLTTGPVDWQQQRSVGFLAIASLTVTLSCRCLVTVSF